MIFFLDRMGNCFPILTIPNRKKLLMYFAKMPRYTTFVSSNILKIGWNPNWVVQFWQFGRILFPCRRGKTRRAVLGRRNKPL